MSTRILIFALVLLCSNAWSAEITIDAGRYTGFYGIGDSVYSGNVTLNLEPGVYRIWIGTTEGITLISTENSIFQLGDDAHGRAKIDDNQLHFVTYPVTVKISRRWNEWKIQRVTPAMDVRATTYLVPGSGYVLWYHMPQKLRKVVFNLGTDGKAYNWSSAIIDAKDNWPSIPDDLVHSDPTERPAPHSKSLVSEVENFVSIVRYTNPVGFYLGTAFAMFLGLILCTSVAIRYLKQDAVYKQYMAVPLFLRGENDSKPVKISIGKYIYAIPLLIFAAILMSIFISPADHNLWPFEIIIWGAVTLFALVFISFMSYVVLPIARFINGTSPNQEARKK
jgi:hypothetical protein